MMRPFVGFVKITGSNLGARTDDPLYESVSAGRKHQGVEHWLPFFHDGLETLFDYLPKATITVDDQVTAARLSRWDTIVDQYETRKIAMDQKSRLIRFINPFRLHCSLQRTRRLPRRMMRIG